MLHLLVADGVADGFLDVATGLLKVPFYLLLVGHYELPPSKIRPPPGGLRSHGRAGWLGNERHRTLGTLQSLTKMRTPEKGPLQSRIALPSCTTAEVPAASPCRARLKHNSRTPTSST